MKKPIVEVTLLLLILSAFLTLIVATIRHQPTIDLPASTVEATPDRRLEMVVDVEKTAQIVSAEFLSFAIDTSQVAGGKWWKGSTKAISGKGEVRTAPFDFSNRRIRYLARQLSPAYLRIGGSDADSVYYDLELAENQQPPKSFDLTLGSQQWLAMHDFVKDANLKWMFTLNGGPSSRTRGGTSHHL